MPFLAPEGGVTLHVEVKGAVPYAIALKNNVRPTLQAMINTMRRSGRDMVTAFRERLLSGRPGLQRRSGALQRSLYSRVTWSTEIVDMTVGSTSAYFWTHVTGAFLSPKTSLYMPIPTEMGVDASGRKLYRSPLRYYHPGQFVVKKLPGDNLVLQNVDTGQYTHHLRRTVYVPPRIDPMALARRLVESTLVPKLGKIARMAAIGLPVPARGL